MKKTVLFLTFLVSLSGLSAQDAQNIVEEGTVLTLGSSTISGYEHIDFPRRNFIIKRGAVANFSALTGQKVIVKRLRTKADGSIETTLKRKDGRNFFRFYPAVTADLEKALAKGEVKLAKKTGTEAIVLP